MDEEKSTDQFQTYTGRRNFLQRSFFPIYVLLAVSYLLIIIGLAVALSKMFPCGVDNRQWEYFSGKCYFFSLEAVPWSRAKTLCESSRSQLVIIDGFPKQVPQWNNCVFTPEMDEEKFEEDFRKYKVATLSSELSKIDTDFPERLSANDSLLFPCGTDTRQWEYFNGKCYYFSLDKTSWMQAKTSCQYRHSQLVIINNMAEQNFLQTRTRNERYWIGLTDLGTEGIWRWLDGSDYKRGFKYWKSEEPNDDQRNEDCAHLWIYGEWNDVYCTYPCYFVCEKPLPHSRTPCPEKKLRVTVDQGMMVLLDANKLQQDQDVLVENGMVTAPRTAGSYFPWWKWTSYMPYLLLALAFLLIIILFGLVFSKDSKISAEVNQLRDQSKDLFPCGARTREWEYFDGWCYYFSVEMATWHTASAHCEDKNAHLVVIHDEAEQNFIQSQTRNGIYWIGLNDLAGEGKWTWVDGTEYKNSFKKWKKGEPNDMGNEEDCARIQYAGEWNDETCNTGSLYVCEKPLPS
ncbi:hypothetical protein lerEdw1_010257 [Lerista edwardsae]|nr:hypothetical protein lerEdw1_010257 [Lerista edwardsae]